MLLNLLLIGALLSSIAGCRTQVAKTGNPAESGSGKTAIREEALPLIERPMKQAVNDAAKGRELMAMVEDEEEGRAIAELYGITMVEYTYKVAVYTTDEEPETIIRRGRDNGWPTLEINRVVTLD